MKFRFNLLILMTGIFIFLINSNGFAQNKNTEALDAKLSNISQEEIIPVWIYFTDKGSDLNRKLDAAETNLLPHAEARRLRNRPADKLVDFFDIPVQNEYVRQISSQVTRIRHKSRWLNAVSAEATRGQINRIEKFTFVKKIDLLHIFKQPELPKGEAAGTNGFFGTDEIHSLDYGPSLTQNQTIGVPPLHDLGYDGSGIIVCMLDAGFNNLQHEAFASLDILKTWDFVNGDSIVEDQAGQMGTGDHGTYTFSLLGGYAPGKLIGPAYGASFLLAKTENTDSETHIEEDNWIAGAEWGDSLGADVISSSLGYRDFDPGQTSYTWQDMDGNTAVVTIGADLAASRGILVVNSAGNEGDDIHNTLVAPSDGDSVLAVGAVSSSLQRTSYSSVGPTADGRIKPDVMAMGSGVTYASPSDPHGYGGFAVGTSFSCPLTAGASALVLQANPHLSNVQIIEALRQTANNAANPDKYYGWGVINAYDAAFYFTPKIVHDPLKDTEQPGPYTVQASITSQFNLIADSLQLFYRYDQGSFQAVTLQNTSGDMYEAQIPAGSAPTDISYYIRAKNSAGVAATNPRQAPAVLHQFHVGADVIPPTIAHTPLQNVAYLNWPVPIKAYISDNLGVNDSQVFVEWRISGVDQTNFPLLRIQDSLFTGQFNSDTTEVAVGDTIAYRIHASDLAANANTVYHPAQGYHTFEILSVRGSVLVIDDESGSRGMVNSRGQDIDYQPNGAQSTSSLIEHYLQNLNFLATTETVSNTNPTDWGQYNLIISASGENPHPVSDGNYRQAIMQYVADGGKLLIEGGEVGYEALAGTGYQNFAANVLHAVDWDGDQEGALKMVFSQNQHPLVTTPNSLPNSITLDYNSVFGYYDQDAIAPDAQSYLVYETDYTPGDAGILVYDNNNNPASAQIVYWAFDFSSVTDTVVARNMLENTVAYLSIDDTPIGIGHPVSAVPKRLMLSPNYPNPFNPATIIRFQLPVAGDANLSVYNSLGQKVEKIVSGYQKSGNHEVEWNAANFASGVYYIVLKFEGRRIVRKAVLMK